MFFSPFSIAITSLWEESFLYVCSICFCFVLSISSSSWCLGLVIVVLPGLFSYLFRQCDNILHSNPCFTSIAIVGEMCPQTFCNFCNLIFDTVVNNLRFRFNSFWKKSVGSIAKCQTKVKAHGRFCINKRPRAIYQHQIRYWHSSPQHEKTPRLRCTSNEDSNQSARPRSLIRIFVVTMKRLSKYPWLSKMRLVKILIRLCKCVGESESSLFAHVFNVSSFLIAVYTTIFPITIQ